LANIHLLSAYVADLELAGKTMPAQDKQGATQEKQESQRQSAALAKLVLDTLGQPADLHRVQVRRLWDNHYRINVLTGADAACAKIANSYFLVADEDGKILASTPKIARQY
jgi:hypothetical protein